MSVGCPWSSESLGLPPKCGNIWPSQTGRIFSRLDTVSKPQRQQQLCLWDSQGRGAAGRGRKRKKAIYCSFKLKISSICCWSPRKAASALKAMVIVRREALLRRTR